MIEIKTPLLSDDLVAFVQERIEQVFSAAMDLTAAEMLSRGYVDGEGEPSIGVYPVWQFAEPDVIEGDPAPVSDLVIRLAGSGETLAAPTRIHPFRTESGNKDGLLGYLAAQVHFEITCRMNPGRPLQNFSTADLEDLSEDEPDYVWLRAHPRDTQLLERATLAKLARSEMKARNTKQEAGQ